jgi:hypothetical protein
VTNKKTYVFDFSQMKMGELEQQASKRELEIKELTELLSGLPVKCSGCGDLVSNRDRLRVGHDFRHEEFVVCKECGLVLLENMRVPTASLNLVKGEELEQKKAAFSAMQTETAKRVKHAEEQAGRLKKLEASGFLARFDRGRVPTGNGIELDPPKVLAPHQSTLAEAARVVKSKTNAQKKREQRVAESGNGADPEPPTEPVETQSPSEGEALH